MYFESICAVEYFLGSLLRPSAAGAGMSKEKLSNNIADGNMLKHCMHQAINSHGSVGDQVRHITGRKQ